MKAKHIHYEMAVVTNDLHVPHHDRRALKLLEIFLADQKPEVFIINGDFLDMWEVSQFDRVPKAGKPLMQEIRIGRKVLERFREILPKSEIIIYIEGNHDFRLRRYLLKKALELYRIPQLSIPELLRLEELNITYKPVKEGANRFSDNWVKIGDLYIGHWDKVNKHAGYTAKNLLDEKGVSLLQGHTHKYGVSARRHVDGKEFIAIENFCLCKLDPDYLSRPSWSQGFSVIYHKKGKGDSMSIRYSLLSINFSSVGKEYSLDGARGNGRS